MKKNFTISLVALMMSVIFCNVNAQQIAQIEQFEIESKFFDFPRTILVYTPSYYEEYTEAEYDVVYVFDAQTRSLYDMVHALLHGGDVQDSDENWRDYIVVGVSSPYIEETGYDRSNDFLPIRITPEADGNQLSNGNSANFKRFIKEELNSWIADNYRTTGHSLAIGHSLGASFILDAMITDELFDDYIAISPNLCWDNYRFADSFMQYDFYKENSPHFIYITMGDEPISWSEFLPQWGTAWERVKEHTDALMAPEIITVRTAEFPDYEHNKVILPALLHTLREYYQFRSIPVKSENNMSYPVEITLSGENLTGEVYITGNQNALGNWNPATIKMQKINDTTWSIRLNLTLPAEFKFTNGSWETQITTKNGGNGNLRIISPHRTNKHYIAY